MRVNLVTYGAVEFKDDQLYSALASARYRVIQPLQGLAGRGHMVSLVQMGKNSTPDGVLAELDADIVVFTKLLTPDRDLFEKLSSTTRAVIERLRGTGRRVVADFSDNLFEHPLYGGYFRDFVGRMDAIVTSTPELSVLVSRFTECPVAVVTDPFEGPRGEPRFQVPARRSGGRISRWLGNDETSSESFQLVWFGHQTNWTTMREVVKSLLKLRGWAIELEIITARGYGVDEFCEEFNAKHGQACRLRFTPWSLSATWEGLRRAALVLIPSWPDDSAKTVKSPNRLVESLRAGRFAVANSLPAYQPLASYCWLGDNIVEGLIWALDNAENVQRQVLEGQAFVEATYSPEVIAGAWEAALANLLGRRG